MAAETAQELEDADAEAGHATERMLLHSFSHAGASFEDELLPGSLFRLLEDGGGAGVVIGVDPLEVIGECRQHKRQLSTEEGRRDDAHPVFKRIQGDLGQGVVADAQFERYLHGGRELADVIDDKLGGRRQDHLNARCEQLVFVLTKPLDGQPDKCAEQWEGESGVLAGRGEKLVGGSEEIKGGDQGVVVVFKGIVFQLKGEKIIGGAGGMSGSKILMLLADAEGDGEQLIQTTDLWVFVGSTDDGAAKDIDPGQ